MAELDYKSTSLSDLYVFYDRLKDDGDKQKLLWNNINSALGKISSAYEDSTRIVNTLDSMASSELQKELNLLQSVFKVKLVIDFNEAGAAKKLIDTINSYMNLKEVYDRNIQRIVSNETQISIAQLFDKYFSTVWNANKQRIGEDLNKKIFSNPEITAVQAADEILTKELPLLVKEAVTNMFESNAFKGANDENSQAYAELIDTINNTQGGNEYLNQLYNLYHLDEFKAAILDVVKNSSAKAKKAAIKKINSSNTVSKNRYQDGGISLEYLENLITNKIIESIKKNNNIQVGGSVHSGATRMKADNIIVFNIDPSIVDQAIENDVSGTRKKNVELIKSLGKELSNIKDGFIVYSSAKNYSLTKDFISRGFSGGSAISINTFKDVIGNMQPNIDTFIGGMLQTMQGAVGEGMKIEYQQWIAEDIAFLLFDDFDISDIPKTTTQAIHIFDLDGILLPLSYFLWLLARSIGEGLENPNKILKSTINLGSIIYPTGPYTKMMWEEQKEQALNTNAISIHFLTNFTDIIKKYIK